MEGRICITGATGFLGRALVERLRLAGRPLVPLARRACGEVPGTGSIGPHTEWRPHLQGVDTVVHLAARVHVMAKPDPQAERAFSEVNTHGSVRLARQAAEAGVRRLVFVSSVKVHGEATARPFVENDPLRPRDPYARSKAAAERALREVAAATGLELVIIRPPLVYGPGVGGNLERLLRLVARGIPLPLGAVRNARSLVGRENLADLITCCIEHPQAAGQAFLVADVQLSTPELIQRMASLMGKPARLLPLPPTLLGILGRVAGHGAALDRLCGSLLVDSGKARERLGWRPPVSVDAELRRMVEAFLARP